MSKIILVGDPHSRVNDLDEIRALFNWVLAIAVEKHCDRVVIMGDLYDGHSLARVEVFQTWRSIFKRFQEFKMPVTIISGNHDMDNQATMSWLDVHEGTATVVSAGASLIPVSESIWACSFTRSNDEFYQFMNTASQLGAKVLLCHQEANGCDYGNGFYSPSGFDIGKVPAGLTLISGHIHKKQSMSRSDGTPALIYVGSSRYISRTDAGDLKEVFMLDSSGHGTWIQVPEHVIEPYRHYSLVEGGDVPVPCKFTARTYVDVSGSKEFVQATLSMLPKECQVRTTIVEDVKIQVKESDGIPLAFSKYATGKLAGLSEGERKEVLDLVYTSCPVLRQ